jgi:hypothetical protein
MSQGSITFMHLIIAAAGAGVVYYGMQGACNNKMVDLDRKNCLRVNAKKTSACDKYNPKSDKLYLGITITGFAIILVGFLALSFMNGGLFSGGLGGGGYQGYQQQW